MIRISGFLLFVALALQAQEAAAPKIDFVRDVQPLFKPRASSATEPEKPKGQFRWTPAPWR
jgi:hypothetical protein